MVALALADARKVAVVVAMVAAALFVVEAVVLVSAVATVAAAIVLAMVAAAPVVVEAVVVASAAATLAADAQADIRKAAVAVAVVAAALVAVKAVVVASAAATVAAAAQAVAVAVRKAAVTVLNVSRTKDAAPTDNE